MNVRAQLQPVSPSGGGADGRRVAEGPDLAAAIVGASPAGPPH